MKYQEKIKTDRYPPWTALVVAVIIEDKGNRWSRGLAVYRRPRVQSSAPKKKEDTLRVFNYLSCVCIPHLTWRVGYHSTHNGTSLSPCCSSISHWKAESEKGRNIITLWGDKADNPKREAEGMAGPGLQCLPSIWEASNSIPTITKEENESKINNKVQSRNYTNLTKSQYQQRETAVNQGSSLQASL